MSSESSAREQRLQELLVAVVEAEERGEPLSLSEWRSRHPEFASELTEFLAGRDRLAALRPRDDGLGTIRYFGDYELLHEIARGGMGVVFKARQRSLDRVVALKMLLHGEHTNEQGLARFLAEADAVARLQHPNVVQLFEAGQHDGLPFFTLEFVSGGSLADKLREPP